MISYTNQPYRVIVLGLILKKVQLKDKPENWLRTKPNNGRNTSNSYLSPIPQPSTIQNKTLMQVCKWLTLGLSHKGLQMC